MNKKDIISFFDGFAPQWDKVNERNDKIIAELLDNCNIHEGTRVLDIACGTGVLFPDYIERGAIVTGIDISPEMVKRAKEKFPQTEIICGDAENISFNDPFDLVMIYNAFPHFNEPERLIENLLKALKKGGRISICHGACRDEINRCHEGKPSRVSLPLPEAEEVAKLLSTHFQVDVIISDNLMYQVSGIKI